MMQVIFPLSFAVSQSTIGIVFGRESKSRKKKDTATTKHPVTFLHNIKSSLTPKSIKANPMEPFSYILSGATAKMMLQFYCQDSWKLRSYQEGHVSPHEAVALHLH